MNLSFAPDFQNTRIWINLAIFLLCTPGILKIIEESLQEYLRVAKYCWTLHELPGWCHGIVMVHSIFGTLELPGNIFCVSLVKVNPSLVSSFVLISF